MSFQRALVHGAKCSFFAAALVEEMLGHDRDPCAEELADLLLRLDDLIQEVESAQVEVRAILPRDLP